MLAETTPAGRALVTGNIRDFVPLDQRYKASGRAHGGLVLVSTGAFPQDRSFIGALVAALHNLLGDDSMRPDAVMFVRRRSEASNDMPGTTGAAPPGWPCRRQPSPGVGPAGGVQQHEARWG